MTRSPILAILALAFLAAPALACGNGECEPPPPPPEKPPVVEPPPPPEKPPVVAPPAAARLVPEGDRDPAPASVTIHYGYCCQIDGAMQVSTGWLRDPVTALEQCRAREVRLQSLPECPRHVRRTEGGE